MLEPEYAAAEAEVRLHRQRLERIQTPPSEDEVQMVQAALCRARATLAEAGEEHARCKELVTSNAVTSAEVSRTGYAVQRATAAVTGAQAELERVLTGARPEDIEISRRELACAEAAAQTVRTRLARLTVLSPIDGILLKQYVQEGEYTAGQLGPAVIVGDLSVLHVRAQVHEDDLPLVEPNASATAVVSGTDRREYALRLVRIEPLAVPKTQLTALDTELVDTRVVEILYAFVEKPKLYPGQIVDTYIQTERRE
jgi:multidrug resistance efflux pump